MRTARWMFFLTAILTFTFLTGAAMAAPSAISTLQAEGISNNQVRLTFTVPNPTPGKVLTAYEVRYKPSSFSALSWTSATIIVGVPVPGIPGTPQSFVITLPPAAIPGAIGYFAIKTKDTGGIFSPISNLALTNTLARKKVTVTWDMVNAYTDGSSLDTNDVAYIIWWGHFPEDPYPFSKDVLEPQGSVEIWLDYSNQPFYFSAQAYVISDTGKISAYAPAVEWLWTW